MKKYVQIFLVGILIISISTRCSVYSNDYERISKRLYSYYGYHSNRYRIDSILRGVYRDEEGKIVIRVGLEEQDPLFEPLVEEMKKVAKIKDKDTSKVRFIPAKLSDELLIELYDEIAGLSRSDEGVWESVRGIGMSPGIVPVGEITVQLMDMDEDKANELRAQISNPNPVVFAPYNSRTLPEEKTIQYKFKNKDYQTVIDRLEEHYGEIRDEFPSYWAHSTEYNGAYINSDEELVILVGQSMYYRQRESNRLWRDSEYDKTVSEMIQVAWPDTKTQDPRVKFVPTRFYEPSYEDYIQLMEEAKQKFRENYFDKNSIWSNVTGFAYTTNYIGLEVRGLNEEMKEKFRSEFSNPNVLFFRSTRTVPPTIVPIDP